MRKLKNAELNRLSKEEFVSVAKIPVVLVLDNIRSLHNVGSAFRTADAFRLEKIFLCGITGVPPHREINKTALGATETVVWEYVKDPETAIHKLREEGYEIIAIEQADESIPLNDFAPVKGKKYALVFGNEINGVQDKIVEVSDLVVEIPQYGTKHSLNISVSIGVVVWDMVNKMKLF